MIDEEEGAPGGADQQAAELLLYDYFKHLTSLSLLSLGGMLALAEKAQGAGRMGMLVMAMATVALAAICSFSGAGEIVRSRFPGARRTSHVNFYRAAAPALLAFGVGGFLYLFARTMVVTP